MSDTTGSRRHGPFIVEGPPGEYTFIATGLTSGRTASATQEVVAAD